VAADHDVRAIGGRGRQAPLELDGNGLDFFLQARREFAANDELFLKARGQAVPLGQARREIRSPRVHPRANFVAVMVIEGIAVVVFLGVAMAIAISVSLVFIVAAALRGGACGADREHSGGERADPEFRFQFVPPM